MKETCPKQEIAYVAIGFALSLIHASVCAVFFLFLLLFLRQGVIGCLKGLLIATTRGILSSAAGALVTGFASTVKWIIILVFSIYILYQNKQEKNDSQSNRYTTLFTLVMLFSGYCIITSFITGSYPVVSAFKVLAYAIPFLAVVVGVGLTNQTIDWVEYCYLILTPVIIASAIVLPIEKFKLVNESFQGVINHPNLFGIFGATYVGFLLYSSYSYRKSSGLDWKRIILLALTFVMIYLSESRTGMFAAATILLVYFITMNSESKIKVFVGLAVFAVVIGVYFAVDQNAYQDFIKEFNHFIMKRDDAESIMDTREALIEASKAKFNANPLLGSGFGVDYSPDIKSFEFSMDMIYESGNLYYTLLADTGILGLVLFILYMGYILINSKPKQWTLFVAPIIISMGEMAFFSTNNVAIYYYIMLGVCITGAPTGVEVSNVENSIPNKANIVSGNR